MKTIQPKSLLVNILAVIIIIMIYAIISDWGNFKAGLAGQAPIN